MPLTLRAFFFILASIHLSGFCGLAYDSPLYFKLALVSSILLTATLHITVGLTILKVNKNSVASGISVAVLPFVPASNCAGMACLISVMLILQEEEFDLIGILLLSIAGNLISSTMWISLFYYHCIGEKKCAKCKFVMKSFVSFWCCAWICFLRWVPYIMNVENRRNLESKATSRAL